MKKIIAAFLSIIIALGLIAEITFTNDFKVNAAVSADLKLNTNYIGLEVGNKRTLLAYVSPANTEYHVSWSSSDTQTATVSPEGTVTAVSYGTATITASISELDISEVCTVSVLSGSIGGDFDFSESNMLSNTSYEDPYGTPYTVNDGGNTNMAIAYLARWDGAVLEQNDEFPATLNPDDINYKEIDADYHLQEAIFIPDRKNYLDNDRIKEAIIEYGAIYSSFAVNYKCFGDNSVNYYRPEYLSPVDGGHAVAIVGWDDDYSRYNFEYTPDGDGAFICKNSWGTSSGENGYFYISYYDASIGNRDVMTAYTGLEKATNYNKIYQYDPYGFVDSLYIHGEKTFYAANVFPEDSKKLNSDEELCAVSFYTYSENTEYEIFAVPNYKDTTSFSSQKISLKSGVLDKTGYYTIDFDPVQLGAGTRFAIIVTLTVKEGNSYFYAETPIAEYSDGARANSGESYYTIDGNYWTDLTEEYENSNFCIKAFTKTSSDYSGFVLSGIDNDNREYESDKIYSVRELAEKSKSEINPEFVEFIESLDSDVSKSNSDSEIKHSAIPSPTVISASSEKSYSCSLPARFNLNDENCLTSVKNQGDVNGCWTFATYASVESCLLRNTSNLVSIPDDMDSTDEIDAIIDATQTELSGITLNISEKTVFVADEFSLTATPSPINAKLGDIKWISSDYSVASVSSKGLVTAKYPGTVNITAQSNDGKIYSSCYLTVNARRFCITWNVDGKLSTQIINEFSPINPNVTPQKTGHTFAGWEPALPEIMPSSNVAYTATWTVNTYNSLFDAAGGKWSDGNSKKSVNTLYNKKIQLPDNPTKEGYDFSGWDKQIPSSMPANNLTFFAKWTPRNDTKYTVNTYRMNTDGQYAFSSETYAGTTEENVTAPVAEIKNGFYLNKEKSTLSGEILGDGTLILSVYIDRYSYTLTTVNDGEKNKTSYYYGQDIVYPHKPYKNGYYFAGWNPIIPETMPANDVTVYAVFEKLYSISIKNNPSSKTVNYGDTLVLTAQIDELPEGTQINWYMNGSGFSGEVSEDGKCCYLTSTGSGSAKITVAVVDENGNPYLNPDGTEVYSSQTVVSNAGFFQMIISFFKNLFGFDRFVVQNIFNVFR